MTDERPNPEVARLRLVVDNLGARIGALLAENVELMARIYELETADRAYATVNGDPS